MDHLTAIDIIEGYAAPDNEEQELAAWQHLIDSGLVWQLQGFYGRNAAHLIESGQCRPAPAEAEA